ncbi:hypothetical protein AVEN_145565-1, partial [Araneus ventricosus]
MVLKLTLVEEISVNVVEPRQDSMMSFSIGPEMPTSHVFLPLCEEIKIT